MKQLQTAQSLDQTWDANIYFFVVQNGKHLEKFLKQKISKLFKTL